MKIHLLYPYEPELKAHTYSSNAKKKKNPPQVTKALTTFSNSAGRTHASFKGLYIHDAQQYLPQEPKKGHLQYSLH